MGIQGMSRKGRLVASFMHRDALNEDLNLSVKTVLGILHSERMKRIRQIGLGEFVRSISLDN